MKILILNQAEVEEMLPIRECINVMAEALTDLARGQVYLPLRMIIMPPDADGDMGLMPSYRSGDRAAYGVKVVCVFAENPARGLDPHQGSVMLFSAETGQLLALMNASAITAIRTAAVSALATRLLAREDSGELTIIGAGVQARSHLEAMSCVREIKRARIVSKTFSNAQRLAAEMQPRYSFPIEPIEAAEAALRGAELIVTATTAHDPVLNRRWLAPGTHINAIGTYSRAAREIDTETIVDARLFVDRRESALNEAGDYLIPAAAGAIGPEHIVAEIGELLTGAKHGRQSPDEITLFKSLGLAVEDLATADYLYRKAKRTAAGTWVEF